MMWKDSMGSSKIIVLQEISLSITSCRNLRALGRVSQKWAAVTGIGTKYCAIPQKIVQNIGSGNALVLIKPIQSPTNELSFWEPQILSKLLASSGFSHWSKYTPTTTLVANTWSSLQKLLIPICLVARKQEWVFWCISTSVFLLGYAHWCSDDSTNHSICYAISDAHAVVIVKLSHWRAETLIVGHIMNHLNAGYWTAVNTTINIDCYTGWNCCSQPTKFSQPVTGHLVNPCCHCHHYRYHQPVGWA